MTKFDKLADKEQVEITIEALKANGIEAEYFETGDEVKKRVFELIPMGAEIMAMTSVTLDALGISKEINESGKYDSVHKKLKSMERKTQGREMQRIGTAPEYALGSVHAVTEDGKVLVASGSGSQLPAYVYGSAKVIWVVSTKKIVKNIEEGMKRIYEYSLPLENERAKKVYGTGSRVGKILIINKEKPARLHLIFINEDLGY